MHCPNCGFCLNKTDRTTLVRKKSKEGFIRNHLQEIKKYGISSDILALARRDLKYSDKTINSDIVASLSNEYNRIITGRSRKVGQH